MKTVLRSRLFRIAMLCFAVLFSQTANAASKTRAVLAGSPPSSVKLCAAWPETKDSCAQALAKLQRPKAVPNVTQWVFGDAMLASQGATSKVSQQASLTLHLARTSSVARQYRAFALRL